MSIQIFLQGKFQGVRDFLESPLPEADPAHAERVFIGRSWWVGLLSEILPRALLAEFGLSRILLGSSGGGQFLMVLPAESQQRAEEFLAAAAADIAALSGGYLRLHWATTENLGDWAIVRRRLRDAMAAKRGAPLAALSAISTAVAVLEAESEPGSEAVEPDSSAALIATPETASLKVALSSEPESAVEAPAESVPEEPAVELPSTEPAAAVVAVPVETAPIETAPVESAAIETAPIETAPIETAAIETAPIETEPVESALLEAAPVEAAPVETAPVETAPSDSEPEVLPVEDASSDSAPVETAADTTAAIETEPIETIETEPEILPIEASSDAAAPVETAPVETANAAAAPEAVAPEAVTSPEAQPVAATAGPDSPFAPDAIQPSAEAADYFTELAVALLEQKSVGWSPDSPGRVLLGKGKQVWAIGPEMDQVPFTRHIALSDDGHRPVLSSGLADRAQGSKVWGVLRGDVDNFEVRLRRAQSIEEHVQLSVLYKQFFAGELEVLCSMPEFWRKVTILYTGGDDFAAFGAWDSLILLARELQRLFRRFGEQSLKDFPGGEAKTISMSLALAADPNASLSSVYQDAGRMLETAKCSSRDCFSLLGRVLEWRQVAGASDLKDTMVRIAQEFGGSTQFLRELAAFYREEVFSPLNTPRKREGELEKPWKLHRRVLRVLPPARDRELEKLRSSLISELVGKNASQIKLRPAGRVALEWARLLTESAQGPPGAHGE